MCIFTKTSRMKSSKFALVCLVFLVMACSGNESSSDGETPVKEQQEETQPEDTQSTDDSPEVKEETTSGKKLSVEDQIIEKVYAINEVQELENSVRKKSGGKRNLSLRISSEPSDDQEYYGVTVAEDNGASLATYYEFHVYPDFDIRFYDVVEDAEITLEEWRKSR